MRHMKLPVMKRVLMICLLASLCSYPLWSYAETSAPLPSDGTSEETGHDNGPGPVITSLEVRGLARMEDEELIDLICFGIGDRLDMQELGRGIRRAFQKGIFLDIKAVTEPYREGVRLIYIGREIPRVDRIIIKGNRNISVKTLRTKFDIREGDNFREEFLEKARQNLVDFYIRRGYPETRVEVAVEEAKKPSWINIKLRIEEGPPLIIDKIETADDIRYLLRTREGGVFNMSDLDKDIKTIEEHYKEMNYIKPVAGPYRFSNGVLTIPVSPGERFEVRFRNNTVFTAGRLAKELSFIENEEITDDAVAESADRIKRLYVSSGYSGTQVAAGVERDDDLTRITFIIFEGEITTLRNITFSGSSINPEAVKKVLPFEESRPFDESRLEDSSDAVIRFYNALGYLRADVLEIKKVVQNSGRDLDLEYVIEEGDRTTIAELKITGNSQVSSDMIREGINIKEGAPYNVTDIGDARRRVLSIYARYGYLDAGVEVESRIDGENAYLTFIITENKPVIVGKIILKGNQRTKAKIIMREFSLNEDDVYNNDEISRIKQRLYKLGIFSEVSVDVLDGGREMDTGIKKDVLIALKEAKSGSVEVSFGYGDFEQFRGSLEISYRNIGGYNRSAGFRTDQNAIERRYIFNFREPWLFNWRDVPLKIFLIREERRGLNIESREVLYKIDKQSFIAGIEKEIAEGLKVGLDYEYSFTDTKDVQEDVILSREDTGTLSISSVSPSIYFDKRNDPFNPSSGSLHAIVVKYASKTFASESEFVKTTLQSSWYFQIFKPLVLAFSLRGGLAYGLGENKELPLIERFFLGGRSTVRGYAQDSLGPKGVDDNPTGGNIFALTNWELRYALGKGFGLVTFIDAGNVWKTIDDVDDTMKYTAGAGFRYNTPVGPVRIDYGHKMNKEEGESSGEVHFSFGHAF